ncbi:MAG: ABC transporter ATP-binding protein [Chloroflexota bacterium]
MTTDTLLQVKNLHISFNTPYGESRTLRGIDFTVERGSIFGIVGESGCGKSLTGKAILDLVPSAGQITDGEILFHGDDLRQKSERERRQLRGNKIGMIFQDPGAALNPVFSIEQQMLAVMKRHRPEAKSVMRDRAATLLTDVGLPNPDRILRLYPHELSGGMQQRVMIATALLLDAELLIADEPTTALDVTIQAQILDLLIKLQEEKGVTIILITHDMGVVAETCDRMAVFYAGRVVEIGTATDIFNSPQHPYTQGLLAALPHANSRGHDLKVIPGMVPSGYLKSPGCAFASRCESVMDICHETVPPFIQFEAGHQALCHLYAEGSPQ